VDKWLLEAKPSTLLERSIVEKGKGGQGSVRLVSKEYSLPRIWMNEQSAGVVTTEYRVCNVRSKIKE